MRSRVSFLFVLLFFVCVCVCQAGSPTPDLSTPSSSTTHQAIRLLYGQTIAKDLVQLRVSSSEKRGGGKGKGKRKADEMDEDEAADGDDACEWTTEVHFTSANYHAKKMTFLLFINRESPQAAPFPARPRDDGARTDRLVESSRIKRAIESIYSGILPKGTSPFVYLRYSPSSPPVTRS